MYRDRTTFRVRGARMHAQPAGFFGRLFAMLGGVVLLVLGLMFSAVVIVVAVAIGLLVWGWIWWKTRALRRQMDEQMQMHQRAGGAMHSPPGDGAPASGRVIEGEVIRTDDAGAPSDRR